MGDTILQASFFILQNVNTDTSKLGFQAHLQIFPGDFVQVLGIGIIQRINDSGGGSFNHFTGTGIKKGLGINQAYDAKSAPSQQEH